MIYMPKQKDIKETMNKRKLGSYYEELALSHLTKLGYSVLYKNYRCKIGEIDLIAKDGAYLVFIEVKYRATLRYGYPREAVHFSKQRKIILTANYFLLTHHMYDSKSRFDVIEILQDKLTHIQNAFMGG